MNRPMAGNPGRERVPGREPAREIAVYGAIGPLPCTRRYPPGGPWPPSTVRKTK